MSSNTTKPCRVMLVDDSSVVKRFLSNILFETEDIRVVIDAKNGKEAIEKAKIALPDVILLDVEMPEMDGLTALPLLLEHCPQVKVIMVSTLTSRNAQASLKAMELGASDYLEKPTTATDQEDFKRVLLEKIRGLHHSKKPALSPVISADAGSDSKIILSEKKMYPFPKALAVGCSTGGPNALQVLFAGLNGHLKELPVFITQHMPPTFTTFLAQRIANIWGAPCDEAKDGCSIEPGHAYLAPGDYHMRAVKNASGKSIALSQDAQVNFCRPAVDPMLESLQQTYGGALLTVILTGMGSDGLAGCQMIASEGGQIIAQDKATSAVWGMPAAVAKAGICSAVLPLDQIAPRIIEICEG